METKNDGSSQKVEEKVTRTIETMTQDLKNETNVTSPENPKIDFNLSESLMKEMEKASLESTSEEAREPVFEEKPATEEMVEPTSAEKPEITEISSEISEETKTEPVQIMNPDFGLISQPFSDPVAPSDPIAPEIKEALPEIKLETPIAGIATPLESIIPVTPLSAVPLATPLVSPETKLSEPESLLPKVQEEEKREVSAEEKAPQTGFFGKNKIVIILVVALILLVGAVLGFYLLKKDLFMSLFVGGMSS